MADTPYRLICICMKCVHSNSGCTHIVHIVRLGGSVRAEPCVRSKNQAEYIDIAWTACDTEAPCSIVGLWRSLVGCYIRFARHVTHPRPTCAHTHTHARTDKKNKTVNGYLESWMVRGMEAVSTQQRRSTGNVASCHVQTLMCTGQVRSTAERNPSGWGHRILWRNHAPTKAEHTEYE